MSRLEHRTDESWLAYDYRALGVLLSLLVLLWGLWYTGHGPNWGACPPAAPGSGTVTSMPKTSLEPVAVAAPRVPPSIEMQSNNGQVRMIGRVDSDAVKASIGASAVSVFGAGNVTNSLTVDSNVVAAGWQSKAGDLLGEVKSWGSMSNLRLDGNVTTLAGAVAAEAEKTARGSRMAALLGPDAVIDNRLFVILPPPPPLPPPAPKLPASVDMRALEDGVHLTGRVDSEATRTDIDIAAKAAFGAGNVTNSLIADAGVAAPLWASKAKDIFTGLKSAGPGKALIATGSNVTLAGIAASNTDKTASETALARILGSDVTLDNRIAVIEPPSVPEPTPVPPPAPAPVVAKTPASVDFQSANGKLKLLGRVGDETTRSVLGTAAAAVFGTGNITNALSVDTATTPVGWQTKAQDVLAQLKSWGAVGTVRADGNDITLLGTAQSEQERNAREDAVGKLFGSLLTIDNRITVVPPSITTVEVPVAGSAPAIDCDTIARGVKIGFESGSSILDATGQRALDDVMSCLVKKAYEITGHTDSVGDAGFNDFLSKRRAESVIAYLKGRGVKAELTPSGVGSSQPVASNALEAGRAQNRRIEFKPL